MISSVDLAHYGVSRVKNWASGDCGTMLNIRYLINSKKFEWIKSNLKKNGIIYFWVPRGNLILKKNHKFLTYFGVKISTD